MVGEAIIKMCANTFRRMWVGEDEIDSCKPGSANDLVMATRSGVDSFTPQFFKVLIERARGFEEDEDAVQWVVQDAVRDLHFQESFLLPYPQVVDLKGLVVAAKVIPAVSLKFDMANEG